MDVFAGYLQQTYVSGQFVTAPTFGLIGYWKPMRDLWVKPFIRRTVDEFAFTDAYLSTTGGLDVVTCPPSMCASTPMPTMPSPTTLP